MSAGLADSIPSLLREEKQLVQELDDVKAQLARGGQLTQMERDGLKEDKKQLTERLLSLRAAIIARGRAQGVASPMCNGLDGRGSALTL